ncbi:repetitive organellar protein-like [Salvelinus sp. IW2-2015]|uniref:repetitive organellar protein-like n=1 Tax=Salvelinus sp. IW2-2015 TaxID=2691554 RepID=UPI0038D499A8
MHSVHYKKLNIGVATATSDVLSTKEETEDKKRKLTKEEEILQNSVKDYNEKLGGVQSDLDEVNTNIINVDTELRELVESIASRNKTFGIEAAVVPFLGIIIDAMQRVINDPGDSAAIELTKNKMNQLQQDKTRLSKKEWEAQTELMKLQMKINKASFDLGSVPDPVHLAEVQTCLTRIQKILLQLKSFWEKIRVMVTNLKQKTFAGEDLIDVLSDFKEEFLDSLQVAEEAWNTFRGRCQNVMVMFSVQSKDAYNFLETSPSSLTQEEWQEMYDGVTAKLYSFYPALKAKQAIEDQQVAESN